MQRPDRPGATCDEAANRGHPDGEEVAATPFCGARDQSTLLMGLVVAVVVEVAWWRFGGRAGGCLHRKDQGGSIMAVSRNLEGRAKGNGRQLHHRQWGAEAVV
jgi:hypothetical protein